MPFHKISHQTLFAALSLLTPSDILPTRQQLATTLLDFCFGEYRSKMWLTVAGKRCTVSTDAWTDVNGKAVVNYVLICDVLTFFLESVYTGCSTSIRSTAISLFSSIFRSGERS